MLQIAFMFGIPAAIFFIGWIGYGIYIAVKQAFSKMKDTRKAILLLFYINIIAFGMVEIVWLTGQLSFALIFLIPLFIFEKKA